MQSFGLQAGTSALSYNAGLSYSERDGISGSAGIGLGLGRNAATGSYSSTLNLGVSYSAESTAKVVSRLRKTGPLLENVK
ncbi:hypothetical protein LEP1GSC040_4004 [Leptospira santarosai str. 2000030832]|nr:hypothetical protein LEP1GSC040_4004 [Leptospira santarosai str. 2000030832]